MSVFVITGRAVKHATILPFREFYISWRFIWRDFFSSVMPASIFMLVALAAHPAPSFTVDLIRFGLGILYFWLYMYQFCLPNQIAGLEEDRINKPDRPLPSGLVSFSGAILRWFLATAAFWGLGYYLGVVHWAFVWSATTLFLSFAGGSKHWFTKNCICMTLGTIAQLGPAWAMITPMTPAAWRWVLVVSLWVGMTVSTQDFRDIDGDQATGRRTLPIVLGDGGARLVMCIVWICAAAFIPFRYQTFTTPLILLPEILIIFGHLWISTRLWRYRGSQADHDTYMIQLYVYCLILLSGFLGNL